MKTSRVKLTAFDQAALVVATVATGALVLELTWPHKLEAPPRAEGEAAAIEPAASDVVAIGPLSDYLPIGERPLFTHDRRPFVMVVEAAPVPIAPLVEFELTAVIIKSATQLALLRSNMTPTVQRVALHEEVEGWTLTSVTPSSVVLQQGETTVTVPLRPDLDGAGSGHAARIDPVTGN